jgi:hypothetical protein
MFRCRNLLGVCQKIKNVMTQRSFLGLSYYEFLNASFIYKANVSTHLDNCSEKQQGYRVFCLYILHCKPYTQKVLNLCVCLFACLNISFSCHVVHDFSTRAFWVLRNDMAYRLSCLPHGPVCIPHGPVCLPHGPICLPHGLYASRMMLIRHVSSFNHGSLSSELAK